jgi:hypothetical protein
MIFMSRKTRNAMMDEAKELYEYIIQNLEDSDIPFETDVGIGGVVPDILVHSPDGRRFAVDIKNWTKFEGFTIRAAKQSELYRTDIGVDRAFIVINGLQRSYTSTGVVTPERLVPAIREEISREGAERKARKQKLVMTPTKEIFAAMPFDPIYDDVFFVAMADAANRIGAVCRRVDQEEFVGDIVEKIKTMIGDSIAVLADLSESKPNVMYEVGYAHALEKPTIHICSTPLKDLPFDVSQWNTIGYQQGQTHKLGRIIARRLRSILA